MTVFSCTFAIVVALIESFTLMILTDSSMKEAFSGISTLYIYMDELIEDEDANEDSISISSTYTEFYKSSSTIVTTFDGGMSSILLVSSSNFVI